MKACEMCGTDEYTMANPHITMYSGRNLNQEHDVCLNCKMKLNYSKKKKPEIYFDTIGVDSKINPREYRTGWAAHDIESTYNNPVRNATRDQAFIGRKKWR